MIRVALGSLVLLALFPPPPMAASPCTEDARYAAIEPWIGEWRIVDDIDGERRDGGTTKLAWILDGCAVEEVRRLADGTEQRGLLNLDPVSGIWRESWVSNRGDAGIVEFTPTAEGAQATGLLQLFGGAEMAIRLELTAREGGGFIERAQISFDGWATSESLPANAYLPLGAPMAAAPEAAPATAQPTPSPAATEAASPTPAEVPAEARPVAEAPSAAPQEPATPAVPSKVRVRSKRKEQQRVQLVDLELPMTLEFELGPVHLLPEGSAWRTEELERYTADEIRVALVGAETRGKRGKHRLELTVHLHTTAFQRRVGVEAQLLSGDELVATAATDGIKVGKMIGVHDPKTGRPVTLEFEIGAEQLVALYEAGRPTVRLTVGVE